MLCLNGNFGSDCCFDDFGDTEAADTENTETWTEWALTKPL